MSQVYEELKEILPKIKTKKQLDKIKLEISKKYKLKRNLSNIEILSNLKNQDLKILLTKPTRTISGVTPI